ncbi:MAG: tRNA uridine-5-carboxymethylaminomethyl(34) synthesis GTPase MnmE [Halocynthiibacter sp.]
MPTIFALATARGKAGIAVVRISGPGAHSAIIALAGSLPAPRCSALRLLRDRDGDILDQALVLPFSAGASFTGEDVVELHLHGSIATTNAVLHCLGQMDGLRQAEPGEFTRRALENGCLDLTQVEGLADLIDAETKAQRVQAFRVMAGQLGALADNWRRQLIRAASLLEATIDFSDEDVPVDVVPEVTGLLHQVLNDLRTQARGSGMAERIRDGFEVAIVGPPNIGKSTLLNALAGREAAITSQYAGTTRDVIEVRMDLRGLPVTFLDTAGLRDTDDPVEAIGVQRALERARAADLRVFLADGNAKYSGLPRGEHDIELRCKADLIKGDDPAISGLTGLGIPELIEKIGKTLEQRAAGAALATRRRHRVSIETAITHLENANKEISFGADRVELAAEELRSATRALDALLGRVDVEHVLDEIFSSFCIGK